MNDSVSDLLNGLISILSDGYGLDDKDISDGHHTFGDLYEYRKVYNALLFNEYAKQGLYNVHKSLKHNDGEDCFGVPGKWFIVVAELPTGPISNHYKLKDWDLFQIPEVDVSTTEYDGHTPHDCLNRMMEFCTNDN